MNAGRVITSSIAREPVRGLGLGVGGKVAVLLKSTEVTLAVDEIWTTVQVGSVWRPDVV